MSDLELEPESGARAETFSRLRLQPEVLVLAASALQYCPHFGPRIGKVSLLARGDWKKNTDPLHDPVTFLCELSPLAAGRAVALDPSGGGPPLLELQQIRLLIHNTHTPLHSNG